MFAPARLCTSRTPSRSRIAAAIAAVVVLPLVAEISTLPRCRREPSTPIASGCRRISTFPGTLVAPPPHSRESAPAARARASFGSEWAAQGLLPSGLSAGTSTRTAAGRTLTRSGSSPIGSPSAYSVKGRSAAI